MLALPGYKGRGPGYSVRSIRSSSTASHILCLKRDQFEHDTSDSHSGSCKVAECS